MTIGEKIKTLRTKKGLTQKQLGDLCGMADSAIRRYENGRANPKIETLQKIAAALEVNICYSEDGKPCFLDKILESTGEKAFKSIIANQKDIYEKVAEMPETTPDTLILDLYHELNDIGKDKALEQVELLTKIPEYTRISPEENADNSEKQKK